MPPVPGGAGVQAVSLERRLTLLFGLYVIALFSVVAILAGSLVAALFLIVFGEILSRSGVRRLRSVRRPTALRPAPLGKRR